MAQSPAHKLGQIIGNLLEELVDPVLRAFCAERCLYLDVQEKRPGVRGGKKVSWTDQYGNSHDLDFVIEKGGSPDVQGQPVAFIEAAWRRYTKHSRNKAQEIQGAVLPIAEKHCWDRPFLGAILAGEFTNGSLDQLRSVGFSVLHFPYETIVAAFANVGISIGFDQDTPEEFFLDRVDRIEALSEHDRTVVKDALIRQQKATFDRFLGELAQVLDRIVEQLIVLPLYGTECSFDAFRPAIEFLDTFGETEANGAFQKYEIQARFSNGDKIAGSFANKRDALGFLSYLRG